MELPLTFHAPTLMTALTTIQKGCHARILDESDVDLFLRYCLRLGFIYKVYPGLNYDGFKIEIHGGCSNRHRETSILTIHHSFNHGCFISLFRHPSEKPFFSNGKQYKAEVYNTDYSRDFYEKHTGRRLLNTIQLKDVPVTEDDLSDDKMPLYINIPILGVYAKERLAGVIKKEALC